MRALNLAQHWLCEGLEEKDLNKVRAMMTGPLTTMMAPAEPDPEAPKMPPVPWWFGDPDAAAASSQQAARQLSHR